MEAKACAKHIRISQFTPHKGSAIVTKVLKSAVANAEHNYDMDVENLVVSTAFVDQGPSIKRYKPRAMGRADGISKRTSHITIMVSER